MSFYLYALTGFCHVAVRVNEKAYLTATGLYFPGLYSHGLN